MTKHAAADPEGLRQALRRSGTRRAHMVYECPDCEERVGGQQRCEDCRRFCRAVGPGGTCPDCDSVLLLSELLGEEVPPS
jgi:transcription initiation factor IIE alpha subunit